MSKCPCLSGREFESCCQPFISGARSAPTAESLMRSRYVAFTLHDMAYVERTTHPEKRQEFDRASSEEWSRKSKWEGLEIVETKGGSETDEEGTVEFIASYSVEDHPVRHHELSDFRKVSGEWFFFDGKSLQKPFVKAEPKFGRNDPCPCGSGQKFKKCCGAA